MLLISCSLRFSLSKYLSFRILPQKVLLANDFACGPMWGSLSEPHIRGVQAYQNAIECHWNNELFSKEVVLPCYSPTSSVAFLLLHSHVITWCYQSVILSLMVDKQWNNTVFVFHWSLMNQSTFSSLIGYWISSLVEVPVQGYFLSQLSFPHWFVGSLYMAWILYFC